VKSAEVQGSGFSPHTLTDPVPQTGESPHDLSRCRASLPLLGSNQDSPDPEGPLEVTQLQQLAALHASLCHPLLEFEAPMLDFAGSRSHRCGSLRLGRVRLWRPLGECATRVALVVRRWRSLLQRRAIPRSTIRSRIVAALQELRQRGTRGAAFRTS
jgi:hypothetical protein